MRGLCNENKNTGKVTKPADVFVKGRKEGKMKKQLACYGHIITDSYEIS